MNSKHLFNLFFVLFLFIFVNSYSQEPQSKKKIATTPYTVDAGSQADADAMLEAHLRDRFSILSDKWIADIIATQKVAQLNDTTRPDVMYRITYDIPTQFLADTAKILWELNIPQFESHIYQLTPQDTTFIATWPNVVGRITDKTYAGNFQAFRIRNWPSWKDPDPSKADLPATPPGPGNPLGLFVVHYDENSLRYFHGTNKPGVLKKKLRYESHGCVRNDNDNIQLMKEFVLKRIVKSKDLTGWVKSKKSMTYDFDEIDKFPVKIIYKTFDINQDELGHYIELYKDIYNYSKKNPDAKWNDVSLITLTTKENVIAEYNKEYALSIPKEKLEEIVDYLLMNGKEYERYYFEDLKQQFLTNTNQ